MRRRLLNPEAVSDDTIALAYSDLPASFGACADDVCGGGAAAADDSASADAGKENAVPIEGKGVPAKNSALPTPQDSVPIAGDDLGCDMPVQHDIAVALKSLSAVHVRVVATESTLTVGGAPLSSTAFPNAARSHPPLKLNTDALCNRKHVQSVWREMRALTMALEKYLAEDGCPVDDALEAKPRSTSTSKKSKKKDKKEQKTKKAPKVSESRSATASAARGASSAGSTSRESTGGRSASASAGRPSTDSGSGRVSEVQSCVSCASEREVASPNPADTHEEVPRKPRTAFVSDQLVFDSEGSATETDTESATDSSSACTTDSSSAASSEDSGSESPAYASDDSTVQRRKASARKAAMTKKKAAVATKPVAEMALAELQSCVDRLTVAELKDRLKHYNQATTGTKAVLAKRLHEHLGRVEGSTQRSSKGSAKEGGASSGVEDTA